MVQNEVYILLASIIVSNIALIGANEKDQQHLEAKPQFYEHNAVKGSINFEQANREGNGQFNHENQGPDGIIYGCYGYPDPTGKLQFTYYVSDALGYRVIERNQPVQLFFRATHSTSEDIANDAREVRPLRSEQRSWNGLHFPKGCVYPLARTTTSAIAPQPQSLLPPSNCHPTSPTQSGLPTATLLSPVGGAVGGLLGGLVGGLVQGLGLGLGHGQRPPTQHSCYPNGVCYNCQYGCQQGTPAYVGVIPTIYMPKATSGEGLNWEALQSPSRINQNSAPIYWLSPKQYFDQNDPSKQHLFSNNALFEQLHLS